MGYKLLGFVIWKGAKFYLGRRFGPNAGTKALAAGGVLALGVAGAAVLVKRATSGA